MTRWPSRCAISASLAARRRRSASLQTLDACGLGARAAGRYPHEFSGGQRQRIGIARALIVRPQLHRRGRAGIRARRVDPGADRQPAAGPEGRVRADLSVHLPRPGRGAPHGGPGGGHVSRPAGGNGARRRSSMPGRSIPTRSFCCAPCPIPDTEAEAARLARRPSAAPEAEISSGGCPFVARCPMAQRPICAEEDPPLATRSGSHLVACHFADGQRRSPPPQPGIDTAHPFGATA